MRFAFHQASRKGGRDNNEDCVGHCYGSRCGVFAVADGMGGHPRGEVAARLAVETAVGLLRSRAQPVLDDPARFLADAVDAGHRRLRDYALEHALDDAPRTTLVAVVLQHGVASWTHCGDSRFYLVRDGTLVARTRDHSYQERQVSMGLATAADERYGRNVLYTCLGGPARPLAEPGGPLPLQPGDRLLLCSDGLWDHLADPAIVEGLAAARALADAVGALVDLALQRGGAHCDNVSVLALEWEPAAADALARLPVEGDFACDVGSSMSPEAGPAALGVAAALARRSWLRRPR